MQHVSTYNSHLQATLKTVIALQGCCAHLGSHMAFIVYTKHCKPYWIPNTHNHPVKQ